MSVVVIAAVSENGVIGRDGDLPWHLPKDLKRFKTLTSGHTIIMGRKTFDSCDRRPLPNRRNIVVTRQADYSADGIEVAGSVEKALELSKNDETVFIVGGSEIYRLGIPGADRLELTRVHARVEGPVRFPDFDADDWVLESAERHEPDERHQFAFTFESYARKVGAIPR